MDILSKKIKRSQSKGMPCKSNLSFIFLSALCPFQADTTWYLYSSSLTCSKSSFSSSSDTNLVTPVLASVKEQESIRHTSDFTKCVISLCWITEGLSSHSKSKKTIRSSGKSLGLSSAYGMLSLNETNSDIPKSFCNKSL